ncbi:MAG TPA: TonB-dependent receptor plug domain-containing protein, partial [Pirellulaceae bacterium]|nr:TonB-dependent receptor plug domain-containing protein [Pirellulaceae bacterium]
MLRRHLRNLIRLSVVGATLSCQTAQADEPLNRWLNATGDPAITSADLVTNGLEGSQVAPASYLDPRQIFEDIERETEGETGGSLGDLPLMSAAPTAISSEELEGVGSSFNAGENKFVASSDPAIALQQSNTARGVNVQRRSALSFDPRVRSYGVGQLYTQADGVLMLPVRPDLTTILGATDPWLIQSIDVLKGPYGASYGPGFAFIDVTTMQTPRYDCGPEAHARTG